MGKVKTVYVDDGDLLEIRVLSAGTPKNQKGWSDMQYLGREAIFITVDSYRKIGFQHCMHPEINLINLDGTVVKELCIKV